MFFPAMNWHDLRMKIAGGVQHSASSGPGLLPDADNVSVSSEGTDRDEANDPMSQLVWPGCYTFSLEERPEFETVGWRVGYGHNWRVDPTGKIDVLLAADVDQAKAWDIHANHSLFNVLPDSGFFAVKSLHHDFSTSLDTSSIRRTDGFVVCTRPLHIVAFGKLLYRLRCTVADSDVDHFQGRKEQYMTEVLHLRAPIPSAFVTPSLQDITIGQWTLLKRAGTGAQSSIRAAIDIRGELAAVRITKSTVRRGGLSDAERQKIFQARLEGRAGSTNVIRLRAILQSVSNPADQYILMTPLARGDLNHMVVQSGGPVSRAVKLQLFAQVMNGLNAIHEAGIIHRDIKPANIGVVTLDPPHAVILDFGMADYETFDRLLSIPGSCGTRGYLAPELEAQNSRYGRAVDLWALGCVGCVLFRGGIRWNHGFNPWRDPAWYFVSGQPAPGPWQLEHAQRAYAEEMVQSASHSCEDVEHPLRILLAFHPAQRGTAKTALGHPSISQWLTVESEVRNGKRAREP